MPGQSHTACVRILELSILCLKNNGSMRNSCMHKYSLINTSCYKSGIDSTPSRQTTDVGCLCIFLYSIFVLCALCFIQVQHH